MATPMLLANDALRGDIRTEFLDTLRRTGDDLVKVGRVVDLGVPSTQRTERYFYWESNPYPVRWERGTEIPSRGLRSRSFQTTNHTWARKIDWHEEDAEDDQTGSLLGQARMLATQFNTLPSRILFQIVLGTANPDLLPVIPLAPDGVALFSALDGAGGNRFGVVGGNIVAQTATTAQGIRNDFFSAMERMLAFLDTEGEPFHNESLADMGFTIVYGSQQEQQFREAFRQGTTIESTGAAAGVTNVILDTGMRITLFGTPRLGATNDFFVVADGYTIKPVFRQTRLAIQTDEQTRDNSDRSRDTRMAAFQAFARSGYGVNLPLGTVLVQ